MGEKKKKAALEEGSCITEHHTHGREAEPDFVMRVVTLQIQREI